jgi:hypothetical protein
MDSQVDHQLVRGRTLPCLCDRRPVARLQGNHVLCCREGHGRQGCQEGAEGGPSIPVSSRSHKLILAPFPQLGIRASSTCTLDFDEVVVPAKNVVGEIGKGYKIAIEILNEGRIGIAAQMVGLAQGAFDKSVAYAYQRKQFGKPVGEFQGMAFQFAEVQTKIEAARLLTYNASRMKEEGKNFTKEAAMAKWYSSVVAQEAAGKAIEWAGGVGFTRETGIEKYWRDSKSESSVACNRRERAQRLTIITPRPPQLAPSTRERPIFSCRLSLSSFLRSTEGSRGWL